MDESVRSGSARRYRRYHHKVTLDHPFGCRKENAYRLFVTGVPVNIHRYLVRSWATTLLARVALKRDMSVVVRYKS
jgi:hypothetical protein